MAISPPGKRLAVQRFDIRPHIPDMTALHITTPLPRRDALPAVFGKNIRLKMESLQPFGSFTLGGIGADLAKPDAWKTWFSL